MLAKLARFTVENDRKGGGGELRMTREAGARINCKENFEESYLKGRRCGMIKKKKRLRKKRGGSFSGGYRSRRVGAIKASSRGVYTSIQKDAIGGGGV